jgi:hypothetical protein
VGSLLRNAMIIQAEKTESVDQRVQDHTHYDIQTCGSVCGLVAITSTALACLAKNLFQNVISKNAKLTGFFFTTPSGYAKYHRTVLCTWIVEKTVNIDNVVTKREFAWFHFR